MIIYTVKPGDSVFSIAESNGTTPQRIITDNRLSDPGRLAVGQSLVLLFPQVTYTVQPGDTLQSIAEMYGTTVQSLLRNNPILEGNTAIFPGQKIDIFLEEPPLGDIYTNGYAYPYIAEEALRSALPYLSYLSVFGYGINEDGTLIPPTGGDERLIATAKEYGTVPLMMLTSLSADGTFSNELVNMVLTDPELRRRVLENTAETVRTKGYGGVDVDFEYISGENADEYAAFVQSLRDMLAPEGYEVFVALAPKTSATQPGLLYESHNYSALGEAADNAFLMTYEWGYQFGPPMAVSPVDKVRRVADFAVTQIPPQKLFLGIPSYGYDWRLPYERGTPARAVSSVGAVEEAVSRNAEILFDETAQAPYFTYYETENGTPRQHIVWFQDARSIDALSRLVSEYGMRGAGIWNIMRPFPQMYLVLNSLYNIRKPQM